MFPSIAHPERGRLHVGYRRIARIEETNPPTAGGLRHAIPVDTLDLHRMRVTQARRAITRFLRASVRRHPGGVVRIITGRGTHSDGEAKLGPALEDTLDQLTTIVADSQPSPDGGSYLIRLR